MGCHHPTFACVCKECKHGDLDQTSVIAGKDGITHGEGMQQTSEGGISAYVGELAGSIRLL